VLGCISRLNSATQCYLEGLVLTQMLDDAQHAWNDSGIHESRIPGLAVSAYPFR
jgi:hypothetical protein